MSRQSDKKILFLVVVFLAASFYFIIYSGGTDRFLLRVINKKIPFSLKWRERTLLNFQGVEVRKDDGYFYAPEFKINFHPRPGGKSWAWAILKFENGYISQGKEIVMKNVTAQIPLEFTWPLKIYPGGRGYLKGDEFKMDKFTMLRPEMELLMAPTVILVRELGMEIWHSPVTVRGRVDLEKKYFTLYGQFDRIDVETLASDINIKKFGGRGRWGGGLKLKYREGAGLEGKGEFKLLPPGGDIKTIFLKDLLQNIPEGEARKKLLQGIGEDEYFKLSQGDMSCDIKDEKIKIGLLLKGEKGLLDFAINLPTSLVERFFKRIGGMRL